jgi:hypothetical protein
LGKNICCKNFRKKKKQHPANTLIEIKKQIKQKKTSTLTGKKIKLVGKVEAFQINIIHSVQRKVTFKLVLE